MAEWFVGPIMGKLIDTLFDYLQDQLRWQTGMKTELERLRENHPKIQAVVSSASQVHIIDQNSPLNKWIWQLRDAIDEVNDVLDEFEYMKHEEQLVRIMKETKKRSIYSFSYGIAKKFCKIVGRARKVDPNLVRLEKVVQKLARVSAEVSTFGELLKDIKQEQQVQQDKLQNYRETGSMLKNNLIGRDKEKEFVIRWLMKPEEHQSHVPATTLYNKISILSIVGHGGMGKTTLSQYIYEHKIPKDFELKMWVCVSRNFDVKKVIADMLESHKYTMPSSSESLDSLQISFKKEVSLDSLQISLMKKVNSKKFFLVLDDIWEEDEVQDKIKWENVLAPLAHGDLGSKILITTRMNSTASMIAEVINKKNELLILKGLEEGECLQLLNTHAFAVVENPNDHEKLRSITEELVKKLSGSPLVAKVMGGVLKSNFNETYWTNILNRDLGHNHIIPILKLSYTMLPKYLQNCFAFCSIFTRDHVFHKDDLVRMWIAVGFIQPSCIRGETIEDIGGRYFDILVKKSFFDKGEKGYKMHALLHELAQSVSAEECLRIVGDEDSNLRLPETIQHLSIETSNLERLKKMKKFKNLHSLFITYDKYDQDFVDVLTKFFEKTRSIRLLSICAECQKMIPAIIGCLKHLRYLKLDFHEDTLLPRSVSNLYHLQFLICKYRASHDDLFPRDMNNLSNMRYLMSPHLKFPGIGKLKLLQELNGFEVMNETGYRIEELEHMNDLRILRIEGLENVTDFQEACNAKLYDKWKLTDLSLEWKVTNQYSADHGIYEGVLDKLQPHKNLKKLTMKAYMGDRSAIWMSNVNWIKNLERIELKGWQILPNFGEFPFLKSLCLYDMPIADLPGLPPSLRDLSLHNLDNLNSMSSCLPKLSSLTGLRIQRVPQLRELPDLPPSLRELTLANLDNLNCLPSCLSSLSSLTSLYIRDVPQLRELPDLPPSLGNLDLFGLGNLNCLPSLSSLDQLTSSSASRITRPPSPLEKSENRRM